MVLYLYMEEQYKDINNNNSQENENESSEELTNDNISVNKFKDNPNFTENGKFAVGNTMSKGRAKGSENVKTVIRKAMYALAKNLGKTPDEIEIDIASTLLTKANHGSTKHMDLFLKYFYGLPVQPIEMDDKRLTPEEIQARVRAFLKLEMDKEDPIQE